MNAVETERREHYLNVNYGLKSWLLTTDHKRIAWLYLVSVTFFFFIGGLFATLIRLELLTPQGDLVQAETYNKFFTMHGVTMIFFFLIPSIPAVLGNFLIPIMIGIRKLPSTAGIDGIRDRKSTRLNSSHPSISYAVFCLKKKNKI